jgi:tight adherence protein C
MTVLLPLLTFICVFAGVLVFNRRTQRTTAYLSRHQIVGPAAGAVALPQGRTPILNIGPRSGALTRLAGRLTGSGVREKAETLLREAGSPMPVATYLLMRVVFMFVLAPLFVYFVYSQYGTSMVGIVVMFVGGFTLPNLPSLRIKRKARKRAKSIEHAMPDAIDLLVVCAEGGLSLDGSLQQVSRRTDDTLATELQRLLSEIGSGKGRREALIALGGRSQSESLKIFCTTMVQADKMGMSIGTTLRTLADTMRTRRRQAAETQARKAPIKMLPFLVFFMIPSVFIVILAPAALNIIGLMQNQ